MSADLSTSYLGLALENPLVASAGPLTGRIDSLVSLASAGAAAVVLPSLFEEDVLLSAFGTHRRWNLGRDVSGEASSYLPEPRPGPNEIDQHLELVARAKAELDIPVIASLNGRSQGGWLRYAQDLVEAGADALELNVYAVAADPGDTPEDIERGYVALIAAVRRAVAVPFAVKMSPFFTAVGHTATAFIGAGADGLVMFNRFLQPDLDIEEMRVVPTMTLTTSADLRIPLRWVALLRGELSCSLALSSGVHEPTDVVKAVVAGADVVMTTSALLRHGPGHLTTLRSGLVEWLDAHEYESLEEAKGCLSAHAAPDPDAYERANYVRVVHQGIADWS